MLCTTGWLGTGLGEHVRADTRTLQLIGPSDTGLDCYLVLVTNSSPPDHPRSIFHLEGLTTCSSQTLRVAKNSVDVWTSMLPRLDCATALKWVKLHVHVVPYKRTCILYHKYFKAFIQRRKKFLPSHWRINACGIVGGPTHNGSLGRADAQYLPTVAALHGLHAANDN